MRIGPWGLALLVGCGTPWVETEQGGLRRLTSTLNSTGSGTLRLTIKPDPGETAMLVTIEPVDPALEVHVRTLEVGNAVPFRADVEVNSARAKTNAGYIGTVVNLNWPVLPSDGPLLGVTHKVGAGLVNSGLSYTKGRSFVSVLLKRDSDLAAGDLDVNVVFAGRTGGNADTVAATERAVEIWREIYRSVGIEINPTWFDYDGDSVLQAPGQGDPDVYREIAQQTGFGGVNLVIVDDIAGFSDVFGFAGDIPGPLVPTGRSGVVVSAGLGAGPDGVFSPAETQLLAETMAHEVGHFLGLYHPVETTFQSWDALGDTAECEQEFACIQALGTNLMFPFPICDGFSCVPQTHLTEEQGGVAHRYTGVR